MVDLSSGEPDPRLLPVLGPRLRRLASMASSPVSYHTAAPWPDLVDLGRERLLADGLPAAGTAFTITSGALDAIERLLTAHLRPGDRVGVEDPGWANLIDLVAALGLDVVGVPVDDEGPTVDGLAAAVAAGIRAVVVTSRAQNPTGAAVSPQRAAALRTVIATAGGREHHQICWSSRTITPPSWPTCRSPRWPERGKLGPGAVGVQTVRSRPPPGHPGRRRGQCVQSGGPDAAGRRLGVDRAATARGRALARPGGRRHR